LLRGREWAARYEQLRQQAIAGSSGGWGLALFCRRGLVAWMRAWPSPLPSQITQPDAPSIQEGESPRIAIEPSLREPLVHLLAGMILETERKVSA